MPPRKAKNAAKASIPSLQGCVITLGATTIPKEALNGMTVAELKTEIAKQGGTFVNKVDEATHIVLTQTQLSKSGKKVEEAKAAANILLVSYDWLETSLSATEPVDEQEYSLSSNKITNGATKSSSATSPQDDTKAKPARKRKRDAEEDDEETTDAKPHPILTKATNVTKKTDMKIP